MKSQENKATKKPDSQHSFKNSFENSFENREWVRAHGKFKGVWAWKVCGKFVESSGLCGRGKCKESLMVGAWGKCVESAWVRELKVLGKFGGKGLGMRA